MVSGTSSSPLLLLVIEMDYDWTSENWAGGPKKVLCRVQAGPGGMAKIVGAVGQARETGFRPPVGSGSVCPGLEELTLPPPQTRGSGIVAKVLGDLALGTTSPGEVSGLPEK